LEAPPASARAPPRHLAAGKRGLKNSLKDRLRTVVLMLDETIITETPPLYSCYGRIGQQVSVPISGSHKRRILHGAINVATADVLLEITKEWNQVTHRVFLSRVDYGGLAFEDDRPNTLAEALAALEKGIRAWYEEQGIEQE
jgi:hypothetical protein